MGISDGLRRLDDRADKWAQRYGLGLTGPDVSQGRARRVAMAGAAAVAAIVALARIAAGDPVLPVLLGTLLLFGVVAFTFRGGGGSEASTQARAKKQLRVPSGVLMVLAAYFAVEEVWVAAALLTFLVVFFNVGVWAIQRHRSGDER